MSAAIWGSQHPSLLRVVSTTSPPCGGAPPSPDLKAVPGSSGWWYVVSTDRQKSGIWNGRGDRKGQVLSWCPEVLARLAALNTNGTCQGQHYVVRVNQQLALLSDRDLPEGKGWEQFTTIDVWESLALKDLLAEIVHAQAQRLPRIVFREGDQ